MKLPQAEAYCFVVGPFCYGVWFVFHNDGYLEGSIVQRLGTMAEWRKL